jgi:hypothetical protein
VKKLLEPSMPRNLSVHDLSVPQFRQSLGIAGHQDLLVQRLDLGTEVGNEFGDVGMAGLAVGTICSLSITGNSRL